jgi:hypothetical protein
MKPKKLNKKLTFNKSTIANLNSKELKNAYGGMTPTCKIWECSYSFCNTCVKTCPRTCDDWTCNYDEGSQCIC